jgi:hypothetical protein
MVVKNSIINFELDNHVERDWVNDISKCTTQEVVLLLFLKKIMDLIVMINTYYMSLPSHEPMTLYNCQTHCLCCTL